METCSAWTFVSTRCAIAPVSEVMCANFRRKFSVQATTKSLPSVPTARSADPSSAGSAAIWMPVVSMTSPVKSLMRVAHTRGGWLGSTRKSSHTASAMVSVAATMTLRRSYGANPIGRAAIGNSPAGSANAEGIVASATSSIRHRFMRFSGTSGSRLRMAVYHNNY